MLQPTSRELVSRIPESANGGPYGKLVQKAITACLDRDEAQDETAAQILDILVDMTSEHTLSLVVRTLRKEPV